MAMAEYIEKNDVVALTRKCSHFNFWWVHEPDLFEELEKCKPADVVERRSCNACKYYEGVHHASGHAPCSFWKIGGVMWNDFCSRWEKDNG